MYEIYAKIRDERGLSDYAVAKACGWSQSTLSDWKSGRTIPSLKKLRALANFLNVSEEYIETGDESLRNIPEEIDRAAAVDPDIKELFSLAQKATPEQRAQAVRIFHALIGDYDGKDNYSTD